MRGETLGRYTLLRELGSGGSGTVVLARDEVGSEYAIKLLHKASALGEPRSRDERPRVDHENIVRTYEVGTTVRAGQVTAYAVMEYVPGDTLDVLLEKRGPFDEAACRHVLREVASGLRVLHDAGALHLDVKPSNLIWTDSGRVKLLDVIAPHARDESAPTAAAKTTLRYAAPETILRDAPPADGRADLFSLGVTVYELFTGHPPFEDTTASRAAHAQTKLDVPPLGPDAPPHSRAFRELVEGLTTRERDQRTPSAAELLRLLSAGSEQTSRALHGPQLAGRTEELGRMLDEVRSAHAGSSRRLCLVGEAGVGKTTLLSAFVESAAEMHPNATTLVARFSPSAHQSAVGALLVALQQNFDVGPTVDDLRALGCPERDALPAFAALLANASAPEGAESLTTDVLATLVIDVLVALSSTRTLIVVIEDVHFAPAGAWPYITRIGDALQDRCALVVVTARPEAEGSIPEDFERITLERMSASDVYQYLQSAIGTGATAEALVETFTHVTGGLPILMDATLREMRSSGVLKQRPGLDWILTSDGLEVPLPESLVDTTERRLDALDHGARDYVDVAACCGFRFDPRVVADALGLHAIAGEALLRSLWQEHGLVRRGDAGWEFAHHLLYEFIASQLPTPVARTYHSAIAEVLEQAAGDELDGVMLVRVCEHRLHGTDPVAARDLLIPAMDLLEAQVLPDRATALGLVALERGATEPGEQRIRVMLEVGRHMWVLHRTRESRLIHLRAIREARRIESLRLECSAWSGLTAPLQDVGQSVRARRSAERAGRLARLIEDDSFSGPIMGNLASTLRSRGQYDAARRWADEALVRSVRSDSGQGIVRALAEIALIDVARGRPTEAEDPMRRAREMSRQRQLPISYVRHTGELGQILTALGRIGEALSVSREGRTLVERHGYTRATLHFDHMDAVLHGMSGRWDEMANALERSRSTAHRSLDERMGMWIEIGTASYMQALGQGAAALARLDRAVRFFHRNKELPALAEAYIARAEVHSALGSHTEALRDVRAARGAIEMSSNVPIRARCAGVRARALMARERPSCAQRLLERTTHTVAATDAWPDIQLRLLTQLAASHVASGRVAQAVVIDREARQDGSIPDDVRHGMTLLRVLAAHGSPERIAEAEGEFATHGRRLPAATRLACLEQLSDLTLKESYAESARSLRRHIRDHAPAETRAAMA